MIICGSYFSFLVTGNTCVDFQAWGIPHLQRLFKQMCYRYCDHMSCFFRTRAGISSGSAAFLWVYLGKQSMYIHLKQWYQYLAHLGVGNQALLAYYWDLQWWTIIIKSISFAVRCSGHSTGCLQGTHTSALLFTGFNVLPERLVAIWITSRIKATIRIVLILLFQSCSNMMLKCLKFLPVKITFGTALLDCIFIVSFGSIFSS